MVDKNVQIKENTKRSRTILLQRGGELLVFSKKRKIEIFVT